MTDLLELPVVEPVDVAPTDDLSHIVCCNPDRALCGKDVSREPWCDEEIDEATDCEACVNRRRLNPTCGDPECPVGAS